MNKLKKIKIVKKPWGAEYWFAEVPGKYLGKVLFIKAGMHTSLHYHLIKEETMLVVAGTLDYMQEYKNKKRIRRKVKVGGKVHIVCKVKHSLGAADKDVLLFEVSSCFTTDSVRVFDFMGRKCDE